MIKEKIYDYFLKTETERQQQETITFAPSYFSDCKRKIYYKKTGEPITNPIDSAGYFKMELGKSGHLLIQNILKNIPDIKILDIEKKGYAELETIGYNYYVDCIAEIAGEKWIIEIKTIYGAGFNYIEKDGAKPEHELQLQLYMKFEQINHGMILYVGRDNGFMLEFPYIGIKDEKTIIEKAKELRKLKLMIECRQIPDKDFNIVLKNCGENISDNFTKDKEKYKSDWQCSYCGYKNACWKNELAEICNRKFFIAGKFID